MSGKQGLIDLRFALTGQNVGPPLKEIVNILGHEVCLANIKIYSEKIATQVQQSLYEELKQYA